MDEADPASLMNVMQLQKLFNSEVIQVGDIPGEIEDMLFDPMTGTVLLVVLEEEIDFLKQ